MMEDEHLEKIQNKELQRDTVFGIHVGRFTGNFLDEKPLKFEIKLEQGINVYAKISFAFPMFFFPSLEWMEKYSDCLLAHVQFEKGIIDRPIITGVIFKEGAHEEILEEDFPNNGTIITQNFKMRFNDVTDEFYVEQLSDNAQKFYIKEDMMVNQTEKGFLGAEDADEPIILGQTQVDIMKDFIDGLGDITAIPTPAGPSGALKTAPTWAAFATQFKNKFADYLSSVYKVK